MSSPTNDSLLCIGDFKLNTRCLVAPMAGITDRPFRLLCKKLGAQYAVSEMITSDPSLFNSRKTRLRRQHEGEAAPIAVQIAGGDADYLAQAAIFNVNNGAQIIDINMGCPAKKVCRKAAGSALLADEKLVEKCLNAVTTAVDVPVTLKIRTGTCAEHINAMTIAKLAEAAGIQLLTIHGRTREQKYLGAAEYQTIREVVDTVDIPVIANGDVDSPQKAAEVLRETGAAAVMVGRAGQGRPWVYAQIDHYLATDELLPEPDADQIRGWLLEHVQALHAFYGELQGVRVARKHIDWYLQTLKPLNIHGYLNARKQLLQINDAALQLQTIETILDQRHYFLNTNLMATAA